MDVRVVESTRRSGRRHSGYNSYSLEELSCCLGLEGGDSVETIRCLLERGLDRDQGWSLLTAACSLGHYQVVSFMLQYYTQKDELCSSQSSCNANKNRLSLRLDAYDENGDTPLICAARSGHIEICRLLIESGADVNRTDQTSHQTPLLLGIEHCHDDVVLFLLDCDADVQITDNVGITPLYLAIKAGKATIVEELIEHGCDVDIGSQDHAPIFLATRLGLLHIVQILCKAGCHMDVSNKYGVTPVYEAALKGHVEVLRYLLEQDCLPSSVDMYGQTPLHVAALAGRLPAVQLLIEAGANWKIRNHQGQTAMEIAMEMGHSQVVEYFLQEGVNVLPKTLGPRSLSSVVAVFERGHVSTLEVLIRGCAKLPIPHCLGVQDIFRKNGHLLKLLLLSGIQTVPGKLLTADSHTCQETSDWLKEFHHSPRSLKEICRVRVRRSLGNKVFSNTGQLPLPKELQRYLTMQLL